MYINGHMANGKLNINVQVYRESIKIKLLNHSKYILNVYYLGGRSNDLI